MAEELRKSSLGGWTYRLFAIWPRGNAGFVVEMDDRNFLWPNRTLRYGESYSYKTVEEARQAIDDYWGPQRG